MTLAKDYPVSLICQALDLPRSSYHYGIQVEQEDAELNEALLHVAEAWPTYGYRRVTAQLRRALETGEPEIHHSDQGIQYAATAYSDLLHEAGIAISMAEIGAAWQNGFAERLMRTIKEEEVNLSEYRGYHDAYDHLGRFLDEVYMYKRIHSSLGYLTPVEFEAQWLAQCVATIPDVT